MPVDANKSPPSRRVPRKITPEELKDIELKRIRGELSCAECRRLKLRCDKKVPCGSCCRRGCESICPCGILSAGQGTRFILADTDQLHRKIADMSNRIRQLEDALAILYANTSSERHPLLQDELLKIKFGSEALPAHRESSDSEEPDTPSQSIDALGTLTLSDEGEVKYFGRSAGSETLMMAEEEWDPPSDEAEELRVPLPIELENLKNLFPFTTKNRPNINTLELLESFLPPKDRAWSLCDSYIQHGAYFFRPLTSDMLRPELLDNLYNTASQRVAQRVAADFSPGSDRDTSARPDATTPHALATVFFVFSLGALLDLTLSPYNMEAEHFYDLGRAALSLRSVVDAPQMETVRAIGLMATYHSLAGKKYSRDSAWCLMSLAAKLAQSIGLHRDSARWHMDANLVQQRRILFWEVFSADMSHSLALGRPPAFNLPYVDCEFPTDEEATLSNLGEVQNGFWRMKYLFQRNMFMAVAEATLIAKSPSYATVQDLDRKVREMSFPASITPYAQRGDKDYHSSSLSLRDFYASQHRTVTMIYLHRSFFAQAMLDHPNDPLRSPFSASFLTAYRCACVIIRATAHHFDRCAEMAMRIWFLLYHTFSAAVIVGTVVTRSPKSELAPGAFRELQVAIDLFERTALQSQRAKIALGVLRKLKEKAIQVSSAPFSPAGSPPPNLPTLSSTHSHGEDAQDELAIFGGQTRVISTKSRTKHADSPLSNSSPPPSPQPNPQRHRGKGPLRSHLRATSLVDLRQPMSFASQQASTDGGGLDLSFLSYPLSSSPALPTQLSQPPSDIPLQNQNYMSQMYSSFMDHLANASLSNPAGYTPANNGNTIGITPLAPTYPGHAVPPEFMGSLPPPPPLQSGYNLASAQNIGVASTLNPNGGNSVQNDDGRGGGGGGDSSMQGLRSYIPSDPNVSNNMGPSSLMGQMGGTNPSVLGGMAGDLVELGLSSESGMDTGWLTFMQDCGIMDGSSSSSSSAVAGI